MTEIKKKDVEALLANPAAVDFAATLIVRDCVDAPDNDRALRVIGLCVTEVAKAAPDMRERFCINAILLVSELATNFQSRAVRHRGELDRAHQMVQSLAAHARDHAGAQMPLYRMKHVWGIAGTTDGVAPMRPVEAWKLPVFAKEPQ